MDILNRYILKSVIGGTLMVLVVLVSLVAFFNFLGEAGRIGSGEYGLYDALLYVLLSTPLHAWEMFPVAALIGTLLAVGGLAAHSELVAMRASGISLMDISRAAVMGGVLLVIISILLGDVIAPPAERYARAERAMATDREFALAGEQGIWIRDGRTFINVRKLSGEHLVDGIFLFDFDEGGRLVHSAQAAAARYDAEGWSLENVEETWFTETGTRVSKSAERRWDTQINPDLLALFVVEPDSLSVTGLWRYITYLQRNGLDATRYQFAFWSKVVSPVSILVMIALAIPFVAGNQRSASTGTRLLVGALIGVAFYMLNRVLGFSGEVFDLNPAVIAWLPTVVLAGAAMFALNRIR